MSRRRLHPVFRGPLRWLWVLVGGAVAGAGAFLVIHVQVIRFLRHQVNGLNPLERWVGKLTLLWRAPSDGLLLTLDKIPESYLVHWQNVGLWMMGVGGAFALLAPILVRSR